MKDCAIYSALFSCDLFILYILLSMKYNKKSASFFLFVNVVVAKKLCKLVIFSSYCFLKMSLV